MGSNPTGHKTFAFCRFELMEAALFFLHHDSYEVFSHCHPRHGHRSFFSSSPALFFFFSYCQQKFGTCRQAGRPAARSCAAQEGLPGSYLIHHHTAVGASLFSCSVCLYSVTLISNHPFFCFCLNEISLVCCMFRPLLAEFK